MTSQPQIGKKAGTASSLPPDPVRYQKQLHALMEIAWAVSSTLHIDALLPRIMQKITEIMKAERATFFVVDRTAGELWSKVTHGGTPSEIRLRIGDGIAGSVAQTADSINLSDAYEDARFDRQWDEQTGFRTRSLLCVPVFDRNLGVIAVIQCLNKQGRRPFDAEDEDLLRCISGQCAIALESAFLYEALLERNRALQEAETNVRLANAELAILYEMERQISFAGDLNSLLRDVLEHACALFQVEAAAILLAGDTSAELFMHKGGVGVPVQSVEVKSARGLVARSHLPMYRTSDQSGAIADVVFPEGASFVREAFSAPLCDAQSTIGVIQLANRLDPNAGEDWILRMVSLLAGQVARGIVVRRQRETAEQAERLALLGHSTGAILHDLRTPMTAVSGYAELMAQEDDPQVREGYVASIGRALDHMETMTQEVLAFARGRREILPQKVYMDRFVEAARELLLPETKGFDVTLVINAEYDGLARFDESKIKRVIFNLARNACQAMGAGGTFTWTIRREGERLVFECSDTGPGIPKEMEGKLFESFASYGKANGTGLGLAMARKIVDAHCGKIECQSQPGQGATFRIELPC
jgi:signal transduction histidine kinase/putative methionine-R-sulfoxide reductase with GAF domain